LEKKISRILIEFEALQAILGLVFWLQEAGDAGGCSLTAKKQA
jgi:hypothetical protein